MAIGTFRRIPLLSAMLGVALVAISSLGRSLETAIDRFIRFAFSIVPMRPALALDGFGGFLDPQPGNQPISDQLYQRNRHEAHSHARAAHRGL